MTNQPFRIGDPVMDAAQGRAMVVVAAPDETVAEWSEREGYDLLENYANSKFSPDPTEAVVECAYVSDVRSEPSKTYTFPVSRCVLIDVHHADGGRRLASRVEVELLADMYRSVEGDQDRGTVTFLAEQAGVSSDAIDEARELAHVEQTIPQDGGADE